MNLFYLELYLNLHWLIFWTHGGSANSSEMLATLNFQYQYSMVGILAKDTSTCTPEEVGIKPVTFWLVDHLLHHSDAPTHEAMCQQRQGRRKLQAHKHACERFWI